MDVMEAVVECENMRAAARRVRSNKGPDSDNTLGATVYAKVTTVSRLHAFHGCAGAKIISRESG